MSGLTRAYKRKRKLNITHEVASLKMLDCFCGMGGVSDGFAKEGYDVTGIDIVDAPKILSYKHKFIQADMLELDGKEFQGYDVIWGSPPCREFTPLVDCFSHRWKKPPNLDEGLETVNAFLKFVESAKPKIWIMENHPRLAQHIPIKPIFKGKLSKGMRRVFWGNFPSFLLLGSMKPSIWQAYNNHKTRSWDRAKIPLACSLAFARACKTELLELAT